MRERLVWAGVAAMVRGYAWVVAYTMVPTVVRLSHVSDWDGVMGWSMLAGLLTLVIGGLMGLILDGGLEWAEAND